MSGETTAEFTRLLEYLRTTRGFDFTGYKVSSLMRRMRKRMAEVAVRTYTEYIDFLEVHPHEFDPLFNSLLINVTGFFRDPEAWQFLAAKILPRLLGEKPPEAPIRVWCAGCASGEEAYTVAMLLAEAMGEEAFKARVKIYAADADEDALTHARHASYSDREVADIPPDLLASYFEPGSGGMGRHVFRTDLRRSLIFGRHDLVQDAAISRIDLLTCRNTLMYLNSETQGKILARFHFSLAKSGYLFLGKAETLLSHNSSFRPVELKHRIFQRASSTNSRERLLAIAPAFPPGDGAGGARQVRLREAAFERGSIAQLVVDRQGHLALANERARQLFSLAATDLGRLLQDLEISYRPVDLRSAIDSTYASRTAVTLDGIAWRGRSGEALLLELQTAPIEDGKGAILGASLSFLDVTQAKALKAELERAHQDLETAYEELQSTNEELETTNEELHSAVEELETTNEELQSANEELETMNEELQSTNEELRTMNDQLHQRSEEVQEANELLESILGSVNLGVAVLEADLSVAVWSRRVEDLWGVRREETLGKPFLKLDIGIPLTTLQGPIRDCLAGTVETNDGNAGSDGNDGNGRSGRTTLNIDGVNRRGKPIHCRVTCTLLEETDGRPHRVLLVMAESPRLPAAPKTAPEKGQGG
jgi:two-component system CheB/CheR fusion protein